MLNKDEADQSQCYPHGGTGAQIWIFPSSTSPSGAGDSQQTTGLTSPVGGGGGVIQRLGHGVLLSRSETTNYIGRALTCPEHIISYCSESGTVGTPIRHQYGGSISAGRVRSQSGLGCLYISRRTCIHKDFLPEVQDACSELTAHITNVNMAAARGFGLTIQTTPKAARKYSVSSLGI